MIFNKITILASIIGHIVSQAMGFLARLVPGMKFPPNEQALSLNLQLLVTAKLYMPLLHLWGYLAVLVIAVTYKCHR